MVRLWTHETLRVFHDRLIDDPDRVWFGKLLCELLGKHFSEKSTKILGTDGSKEEDLIVGMRGVLFGDFLVPGADPKLYKCAALLHTQRVMWLCSGSTPAASVRKHAPCSSAKTAMHVHVVLILCDRLRALTARACSASVSATRTMAQTSFMVLVCM